MDQRRKAYDIFPQIVICDEFMRRVKNNEMWTLLDPYEVRMIFGVEIAELWGTKFEEIYLYIEENLDKLTLSKQVDAKDLFKEIMRTQLETGLPYLTFKDTINRFNPNKHDGYIPATNLCVESFSNVKPGVYGHCCNLVSLNLANIERPELSHLGAIAVRLLDNTLDLTSPPFPEAKKHNDRYRTIGVGAMGLADYLAKHCLSYRHLDEISALFEDMAYHCTHASMELAKERGAYPAFLGSEWSNGNLLGGRSLDEIQYNSYDPIRWRELREAVIAFGIRNSHVLAIAPNTSSGLLQGCTPSILPTFSRFYYEKWAKGMVAIAPPYIRDHFWHYQENKTLDQQVVVDMTSTVQFWIDTGISMELVFNLNEGIYHEEAITAKEIYEVQMSAWEQGCKAIYYVRTVQKDSFKDSSEACSSCAN